MILVDFSSSALAAVMVSVQTNDGVEPTLDYFRHIILQHLLKVKNSTKKFGNEFVIVFDSDVGYWRKDVFPHYKAMRKAVRQASKVDFDEVFRCVDTVKREMIQNVPWKYIQVDKCEADDVIAVLAKNIQPATDNGTCIVSNDHDFLQLQRFSHIRQYSPKKGKLFTEKHPEKYLIEHIIRGDSGDGIPNIKSAPDTFVTAAKKQKPISTRWLDDCLRCENPKLLMNDFERKRFDENQKLIDLTAIPDDIQKQIIKAYEETSQVPRTNLMFYLASNKLTKLQERMTQF